MTKSEKDYITDVANKIKQDTPLPTKNVCFIQGRSISDLFQAAHIYRKILN